MHILVMCFNQVLSIMSYCRNAAVQVDTGVFSSQSLLASTGAGHGSGKAAGPCCSQASCSNTAGPILGQVIPAQTVVQPVPVQQKARVRLCSKEDSLRGPLKDANSLELIGDGAEISLGIGATMPQAINHVSCHVESKPVDATDLDGFTGVLPHDAVSINSKWWRWAAPGRLRCTSTSCSSRWPILHRVHCMCCLFADVRAGQAASRACAYVRKSRHGVK